MHECYVNAMHTGTGMTYVRSWLIDDILSRRNPHAINSLSYGRNAGVDDIVPTTVHTPMRAPWTAEHVRLPSLSLLPPINTTDGQTKGDHGDSYGASPSPWWFMIYRHHSSACVAMTVALYNITTHTWHEQPAMPTSMDGGVSDGSLAVDPTTGTIYRFGGRTSTSTSSHDTIYFRQVMAYHLYERRWRRLETMMHRPRSRAASIYVRQWRAFVITSSSLSATAAPNSGDDARCSIEVYSPAPPEDRFMMVPIERWSLPAAIGRNCILESFHFVDQYDHHAHDHHHPVLLVLMVRWLAGHRPSPAPPGYVTDLSAYPTIDHLLGTSSSSSPSPPPPPVVWHALPLLPNCGWSTPTVLKAVVLPSHCCSPYA